MKTCSEYRAMARETLDGRWGKMAGFTLVVVLIIMAVSMLFAVPFSVGGIFSGSSWLNNVGSGCSTVVSVLFSIPLQYALYNFFLKMVRREEMSEDSNIGVLFQDFVNNWSIYVVSGVLLLLIVIFIIGVAIALILFLPFLLLKGVIVLVMIPILIMVSLTYSLIPFVIRDNPDITPRQVLYTSRMMMRGHQVELFVLQISFIGWALLCIICPIGLLWLGPYMYTSYAHFYEDVKAEYVPEELN